MKLLHVDPGFAEYVWAFVMRQRLRGVTAKTLPGHDEPLLVFEKHRTLGPSIWNTAKVR
jgi:hypothetical protein